jgi:hypothetical protein
MVYYPAGVEVTARLDVAQGRAGLFAWYLAAYDAPIATLSQEVNFITQASGIYLFLVRGAPGTTYSLSIEPAGGPRVPVVGNPQQGPPLAPVALALDEDELDEAADLIALFTASGFDPMDGTEAPEAPGDRVSRFTVFLPLVTR